MIRKLLLTAILLTGATCWGAQGPSMDFNAGKHAAKGISCAACHGPKNEVEEPTIDQCTQCHNTQALVEKTQPKKDSERNPHMSPHYQDKLECTNCHRGHEEPENFCGQCHSFKFNVP